MDAGLEAELIRIKEISPWGHLLAMMIRNESCLEANAKSQAKELEDLRRQLVELQSLRVQVESLEEEVRKLKSYQPISTGEEWVRALLSFKDGRWLHDELGLSKRSFLKLVMELESLQLIKQKPSFGTEEQVALFLHQVTHAYPESTIAKSFQRDIEDISRCDLY
jgi:hypothetical protein